MKNKKETDRDIFGTPKNRTKTWDIKKSRNSKKDRRENKKEIKKNLDADYNIHRI